MCIFDILFDRLKIQRTCYYVGGDNHTLVLDTNKVSHYIQLDILKSSIDVNDINARFFDKFVSIVNTYGDYDLFV